MDRRDQPPGPSDDEREAALLASYRQRERLQDQIDRTQRSLRETNQELRRTRSQLDKARRRVGFRAQRAIGRVLLTIVDLARRGSRRAYATVAAVRVRAALSESPTAPSQGSAGDRDRALAAAIVAGLPTAPPPSNASVTVVLHWSGEPARLRIALERLEEAEWPNLDVRVVADSSGPDDRGPLDPALRVSRVDGLDLEDSYRRAQEGLDSDYILFLSDSIEPLEPGWLARLVDGADISGAGIAGVRLVSADLHVSQAGLLLTVVDGLPQLPAPSLGADPLDPRAAQERSVAAVDGRCLLVRGQVLDEIGPVRAADLDGPALSVCVGIRQRGWSIRCIGSAVAWDRRPSRPMADADDPRADALDLATLYRDVMADRLSGSFAIAEGPVRVAVIRRAAAEGEPAGDAPGGVQARLRELGMETSAVDGLASETQVERAIEVALLLDPTAETDRLPRHVVTVAWVGDQADAWMGMPRFDDLDIVLVADDATRARVEARTAKAAWLAADPATPAGARDVRDAILRWVMAPRVAIHIGPLTWDAAASWGDTPFGRDVQKAFERRGWPATVHVFAERDSAPAVRADLALHVFGVRAPTVRPWQLSVLWIISHPDFVKRDLCLPYDLIAVGSDLFLDYLRGWLGADAPPLLALHQATDIDRFYPEAGGPPHELLFVGNSRHRRRPILDALAGTTHDLAVYGRNWTADLLDLRYLRGEWIPNDGLRRHYSGAAIVLSDSYADMRDEGFIANRIYDALASGAFVISEVVPGLDEEFDGSVVTYRDRAELLDRIAYYLAHPDERAVLAAAGRQAVLARHTFAHRVDALLGAVDPLLVRRRDRLR